MSPDFSLFEYSHLPLHTAAGARGVLSPQALAGICTYPYISMYIYKCVNIYIERESISPEEYAHICIYLYMYMYI